MIESLYKTVLVLGLLVAANSKASAQLRMYSFNPDEKAYVESLRPKIEDGLAKVLEPKAKNNPSAQEQLDLTRKIMDPKSDADNCTSEIIEWLRRKYLPGKLKVMPSNLHTDSGIVPDDLPTLLYLYKGRADGLFEYTKLTGLYAISLDILWEDRKKWSDPILLSYRFYAMDLDLHYRMVAYYLNNEQILDTDAFLSVKKLIVDYSNTNALERVNDYLLNYFFQQNSYISISLSPPLMEEGRRNKVDIYTYLKSAYDLFPVSSEAEYRFLRKTNAFYGNAALNALLQYRLAKLPKKEKTEQVRRIAKIAMEARLTEATKQLLSRLPESDQRELINIEESAEKEWLSSIK